MSEPLNEAVSEYQEWKDQQAARPLEDVIQEALVYVYEDDSFHTPKSALWLRDNEEVFARAQALCRSTDARERELGADLLGQIGTPKNTYKAVSVDILLGMLQYETEPDVLSSIAYALGHRHDPRAIPALVRLRNHPAPCVRSGVVYGLLGQDDPVAIATLIYLSSDRESDVRDWATFGLGTQIDTDTPAIRDALLARSADEDTDTRGEAIEGLFRRHDPHCLMIIQAALADPEHCGSLILSAATSLRDHSLYPALLKMQQECDGDDTVNQAWLAELNEAVLACRL